jgi:phosphate transport system substrate-binding protein
MYLLNIVSQTLLISLLCLQQASANEEKKAPETTAQKSTTITISGSNTVKSILNYYEKAIESDSGLLINVVGKNSKNGVLDLVNGYADLAVISTPLTYLSKDMPDIDVSGLRSYPLGKSSIAFITHPHNPVKKITMEQIKGILEGNITNWKELGGNDEKIEVVTEFLGGGIRAEVERQILQGQIPIATKNMETATQIKDVVASVPNGLGITSSSLTDETVNVLSMDQVLSQPIIFVAKPDYDERISKFIKALRLVKLNELY